MEARWLVVAIHVTRFNQSECIICQGWAVSLHKELLLSSCLRWIDNWDDLIPSYDTLISFCQITLKIYLKDTYIFFNGCGQISKWPKKYKCPSITNSFFKKGQPRPLFHYFRLFKHTLQLSQQITAKKVHPVYSARIQTHNLWNMSLLP